jgi:hypothetical protein
LLESKTSEGFHEEVRIKSKTGEEKLENKDRP